MRRSPQAIVSLVGAGPGDPELLTLGALRRLEQADVVVHDALVGPEILALCGSGARRIDAGKRAGRRGPSQEWINALLVSEARAGRRVVRLKGGDPFLFGRGGEEALALTRAGIPWEIVPGVSSALAVPASAGIPVTHRGLGSSVAIVPGKLADGAEPVNWAGLNAVQTLVVLMAGSRVAEIAAALLGAGRPASCPVAIVQRGTLPGQRTRLSTLGTLARSGDLERVETPALLVVGEVVRLASELGGWRDSLLGRDLPDARTA
ncbi:MAG TPA: uroporphyrinogen-III C-methyltransferase [Myxococcaceae bacterium]|nr:uroporphyrinogen-III C-methyltransferase [Myxococcaceae bacterium]